MTTDVVKDRTIAVGGGPTGPLLPRVLGAEWTKIRSVPSTVWTLLCTAAATIGLGALLCAVYVGRYDRLSHADKLRFNPTTFSLSGVMLAQLAIGVLGVLLITSEYGSGMVRATFSAVPQRSLVLASKAIVFTGVAVVVSVVSCVLAFFAGQAVLSGRGLEASITSPGVLLAVIGAGLYLTVVGLLGLGIGTIIRSSAGSIAIVFGLLLVLPGIVGALPASLANQISPYLPSTAGEAIFHLGHSAHILAPWVGFGVFCGYAAVALLGGAVALKLRDV